MIERFNMKYLLINILFVSFVFGGFFAENKEAAQEKEMENARLCKLFSDKAKKYKKGMRDDDLAKKTFLSYKERASTYCNKVKTLTK